MMDDVLLVLLRTNAGIAAAVCAMLVLRAPVRRLCGPELAYTLWLSAPVVGLAAFIQTVSAMRFFALPLAMGGLGGWAIAAWLAGVPVAMGLVAFAHQRSLARARRGELGPAVVGLLRPRVVLPSDFSQRFAASEQAVIRLHERAHLLRHDAMVNHALALTQCLLWFNPLVHVGATYLKRDQEMACDATVMEDRPEKRGLYARTMLKAQLFHPAPTLGCGWARHPLEERVQALRDNPSPYGRATGEMVFSAAGFLLLTLVTSAFS